MNKLIKSALAAIVLISVGCQSAQPISTQLPPEAKVEHIYLAVLEDYLIFSTDVNSLIGLPSTTKKEAEAIDKVMDKADAEIIALQTALSQGQPANYALATLAMQTAIRGICSAHADKVPSCAGRQ